MSRPGGVKKIVKKDSRGNGGKLLSEIATISKPLYLDRKPSRSSSLSSSSASGGSGSSIYVGIAPKPYGKTHPIDPKENPRSKAKNVYEDSLGRDGKKSSIWNWRPLKAFSSNSVRNRKFNCCFSLQVHCIEGLPSSFEDASVSVRWRRRDGELVTQVVRVLEGGVAEFEEELTYTCLVYGSRSGPHHSVKYEAKHFLIFASVYGAQELDLGKHRVDLTRLLPLTLEELEEEKSSGKWTTSFRLSGQAKGAVMNVSFGYTVVGDGSGSNQIIAESLNSKKTNARTVKPTSRLGQGDIKNIVSHSGSLPSTLKQQPLSLSKSMEDIKELHEILPISRSQVSASLDMSRTITYEEKNLSVSVDFKPELDVFTEPLEPSNLGSFQECEDSDVSVVERGTELSTEQNEEEELHNVKYADVSAAEADSNPKIQLEEGPEFHKDEPVLPVCNVKEDKICSEESLPEVLDCALNFASTLETKSFSSLEERGNLGEVKMNAQTKDAWRLHGLDEDTESVANEFLGMLGLEHSPLGNNSDSEPESPRERLLRQFEEETLANGFSLFGFDIDETDQSGAMSAWGNFSEDFDLSSINETADGNRHHAGDPLMGSKTNAEILEDMESEALMRQWGLDDSAFQYSPLKCTGGFGSPIDLPPDEPLELPPLAEGLGPFLQTKNGGFVRSMNPALFSNSKTGGSLIMQVSSPVVVPAEMGSDITDILQRLASVGIEKLSMQANRLMPLEDITGKTMQQVAWEASGALEGLERESYLQHDLETKQDVTRGNKFIDQKLSASKSDMFGSTPVGGQMGSEYVSLEDLAPLAMDKIEALSIEGLRIQSGMSTEDAPMNITTQSIGEISTLTGKDNSISGSLGLEGTAGLQLLDIKDSGDDIDGLMGLSLTLDEWMRYDSGDIGDEDDISEQTSKILAAHHANSLDFIRGNSKGERRHGKGSSRKSGLLGNNFTVALLVQLRDPLRNYEPVGTPVLALIQVERVFVLPKPKIYCTVSEVRNDKDEDGSTPMVKATKKKEEKALDEEGIAQFQITEVRIAGLKTDDPGKKKLWGAADQQQSGSRWLLANGMGKSNKQQLTKGKAVSTKSATALTTKGQRRGDSLWSLSSRNPGGAKW